MAINIYAGPTVASMRALPSPTGLTPSREIIWSEDTGRAQSGVDKAKMIGSVVAEKITYAIKWALLADDSTEDRMGHFDDVPALLTAGFFYFGVGTSLVDAQAKAKKFYRGEIQYDFLQVGERVYYKDVSVQVIEQ